MAKTLSPHTVAVVDALNAIAGQPVESSYPGIFGLHRYHAMVGGKRDRVVVQRISYSTRGPVEELPETIEREFVRAQRSVRCFVDRETGVILYAGGWDGPAKWKDGPATEFGPGEHEAYATFTRDGGWGYQGDRARWEERNAE